MPIAAPSMASAVTATVSRESKELGCCPMIFRSEATIKMPIRRNGASTPLTTAGPIESLNRIHIGEVKRDTDYDREDDHAVEWTRCFELFI